MTKITKVILIWGLLCSMVIAGPEVPEGFTSLFNGEDLRGWIIPEGDGGAWQVVDGVIDYRAQSRAAGSKDLWTEEAFGDFELWVDWRIIDTPTVDAVHIILPDGSVKRGDSGRPVTVNVPNADSGIYLRGMSKAQVNIWNWPIGSGEVWGYRTDARQPPEVRAAVTPRLRADRTIGDWNRFIITMKGDRLTVVLNDQTVIGNAQLPGIRDKGPIGLQHHGGINTDGSYKSASSLVQFRNLFIRKL
jgi:hypothetical protein